MLDDTVISGRRPEPTLARTLGFLLRRLVASAHAAVLLSILLLTAAIFLIIRVIAVGFLTLAATVARAVAFVLRRRTAPDRRWSTRVRSAISKSFDRSLPRVTAATFATLRSAAQRERRDIGRFDGTPIREVYQPLDGDGPPSAIALLRDPATWRDLAYWASAVLTTIISTAVVAAAWLTAPAVAVAALVPLLDPPGRDARFSSDGAAVATQAPPADWWSSLTIGDQGVIVGLAIVVALLAPRITRAVASAHVGLGVALLGPGEQVRLQAELDDQRMRRRLTVEAAENERRRIERDLHDGAQQRLVSLAMNLGMARKKFATDPAAAEQLLAEAHGEAKQALGELRTLARGIHPAVLTDRGLDAALSALAGRAGVPVEVDIAISRRLPTPVESAAYFVVSEALTNVTRHAAATRATVSVSEGTGQVVVEIVDDGVGGADPAAGTGLAGLAGRVDSIDGHLEVDSPPGGPTTIRAELPCAS
jgi:signal transduction histidine kinase